MTDPMNLSEAKTTDEMLLELRESVIVVSAIRDLDGSDFENLVAVRTGLTASRVRRIFEELREQGVLVDGGPEGVPTEQTTADGEPRADA